MKTYLEKITLNKNNRGCYILDTVKGCPGGHLYGGRGCYGDCYAQNIAARYGFNFTQPVNRQFTQDTKQIYLFDFHDTRHENEIIRAIEKMDMPFVRIGEMGDPSGDWGHTVNICKIIAQTKKPIVIITKHWASIPDSFLGDISKLNICVNTSVSALDNEEQLEHRLTQYERLRGVCKSVLRVVSCDFNKGNLDGVDRDIIQKELFKMGPCIDTVFRPSSNNYFVAKNIINTKKVRFLKSTVLASVHNDNTYMGDCRNCPDMCGINL